MYEQYLWLIGKLKDQHKLTVEADHRDIHTFYNGKQPVFKLLFGQFSGKDSQEIVISFHIDLKAPEAIQWFTNVQTLHPSVRLTEVHIEDDAGETFLGEDAQKIADLKIQQEVLRMWITGEENKTEIKQFVASKVVGRMKDRKFFDTSEMEKAIIEFDLMKKPIDDGEIN